MSLSFFSQFSIPTYLGVPLITLALLFPWLLAPAMINQWQAGRQQTLQNYLINQTTSQIFMPLKPESNKWALPFVSIITFLILLNLLGLLPYTFTPTTQLSMNMGLAIPLWLATIIIGLSLHPTAAFAHLLPEGTPPPLVPMLIVIETASLLIRPVALGVRLTANLTAGHLLMQLIATAAFVLLPLLPPVAILTALILLLLAILEFAVAMIQAYVFVLLVSLYLEENL